MLMTTAIKPNTNRRIENNKNTCNTITQRKTAGHISNVFVASDFSILSIKFIEDKKRTILNNEKAAKYEVQFIYNNSNSEIRKLKILTLAGAKRDLLTIEQKDYITLMEKKLSDQEQNELASISKRKTIQRKFFGELFCMNLNKVLQKYCTD